MGADSAAARSLGGHHEGAVALDVMPTADGRMWIAVDSLVDMFEDILANMADGPAKNTLRALSDTFRPASTYSGVEASSDDSKIRAQHCTCGAVVISASRMSGEGVVVDAEPADDGEFFAFKVITGEITVAPYREAMDGASVGPRLRRHVCQAVHGA